MTAGAFTGVAPEVLIMAGGEGRRLGALTTSTPKPMLPVGGRPILQLILEQLRDQGVEHVFLAVRHLSHVVVNYFGDGRWLGIDIDYVIEQEPLGSAGAIGLLPVQLKPLLVINGDVITPLPVAALAAFHHEQSAALTIGHVEHRVTIPYGVIDGGHPDVLRLHEKPDVVLTVVAGVYLLAAHVVAGIQRGVPIAMPELIETVLTTGRVVGFSLPGPWLDIGTPETYARADQAATFPAQHAPGAQPSLGLATPR